MANIGYAYVGELADFHNCSVENTPDGMRYCRSLLVRELQKRRHKIYSLQYHQERKNFSNVKYEYSPVYMQQGCFAPIDILFIEWRWETYKGNTPDLTQQVALLQQYHGKIPIILYDASYKINETDEMMWPNTIIADPGIQPRHLHRNRERLLFWSDFKEIDDLKHNNEENFYGYVGNDYERRESFDKYYTKPSKNLREFNIQTVVYGNWLKKSAERDPEKEFFHNHFYDAIHFGGRWSFKDSMKFQSRMCATTHIAKDLYYKHGNITVRFFDSMATNTIGLVPIEYNNSDMLGAEWVVENSFDVFTKVRKISLLTKEQRLNIVKSQRERIQELFPDTHVKSAADFIERYI